MFKESANTIITERLTQMDVTDKKQLIKFMEVQAAYKRARKMKGSIKQNKMKMEDIVAIAKEVRSRNAAKKKMTGSSLIPTLLSPFF
jgi:hypothetical protein